MIEEKIYNNIVELITELEAKKYVREIKDNRETLMTYCHIGKSIVDAQGGNTRAKYGDNLIKKWGEKLLQEYGKNYSSRNLRVIRQFYLTYPIWHTLYAN